MKILTYQMRVSKDGVPYKGNLVEMQHTLKAEQEYVGGLIDVMCIEGIDIIFADEGKILSMPANRVILNDEGEILDVVAGNIFCCRHDKKGNFIDIKPEDVEVIKKYFKPCAGVSSSGRVFILPEDMLPDYEGD